jgi:type II secretory pathway pseudopilin PulG
MKIQPHIHRRSRRMNVPGFTLVEMMISTWVYLVLFLAVFIAIQVFALRLYTLAATKQAATAASRKALNALRDSIREAKTVDIGTCNFTPDSFNSLGTSSSQIGNAMKIYPGTNLSIYNMFYLNTTNTTTNCVLIEAVVTSNALNTALVTNKYTVASYVTNQDIFSAMDFQGNVLTNDQAMNNRLVIAVKLQFYQWEYPIAVVGGTGLNAYDYYQLRTRITRRAFD